MSQDIIHTHAGALTLTQTLKHSMSFSLLPGEMASTCACLRKAKHTSVMCLSMDVAVCINDRGFVTVVTVAWHVQLQPGIINLITPINFLLSY